MTDNPEILFMVTELIKAYQEDYINKNKTEPTETFVKTSMMSSLLAAETVVELNEFNMHGSLHNVLNEIKLIEDKKVKFENQKTMVNFDSQITAPQDQKNTNGTVFYEVCEGQIKEKDKFLDPKFDTNFNPESTSNVPQKTIQAKLTNGVKNKVGLNLNNYLTKLGTKDITKYDVEKCLKCKVDWKDIGFDLPSLEWSLDFSQLLKTINDAIDKLMKEMDPSKIYDQLCLFIKGFGKFTLCPSQLPQIAAVLPTLFIKYTNDIMKLQFDWLFLFGPIVKFITNALANLIENIPKLTKPVIMCLVNGVESIKRFWNFYSDFLKKNGKQIKSIAEGLMLTGQTLYNLVKEKWKFKSQETKAVEEKPKAPEQKKKFIESEEINKLIEFNVDQVYTLISDEEEVYSTINEKVLSNFDSETTKFAMNTLRNNNFKISFDIKEYIDTFKTFADFSASFLYIMDSETENKINEVQLEVNEKNLEEQTRLQYMVPSTMTPFVSNLLQTLVDLVLKDENLINSFLEMNENPLMLRGLDLIKNDNDNRMAINIMRSSVGYYSSSFEYDYYFLKDFDSQTLSFSNFNNDKELTTTFIHGFINGLIKKMEINKIQNTMTKIMFQKNKEKNNMEDESLITDRRKRVEYSSFLLRNFFNSLEKKLNKPSGTFLKNNERTIIINLLTLGELALYNFDLTKDGRSVDRRDGYKLNIISDILNLKNFISTKFIILNDETTTNPTVEAFQNQVQNQIQNEDKSVIISFNSKGDPITIPNNQKALLEKETRSKNKIEKVTGPSTFLQKQLNEFLNKNVINPLNEKAPNSALLKKYGLEGKVILDKPPELTDYIALYEQNIDRPINLVLDNIILALKETQTYIEDFTGSVINALKAINEAFNRKINLTLQLGGRILNIIHTIRFVLLIYKLIQKGFTDCEKISDNVQGAQSIVNSINPDLKLDNVTSNEAKNMISNLNPQASNFEGVDEKKYLAITSETNQSSTLINVTDCNNLGSKMRLDNDDNLNKLYEELYNAHITT